MRMFIKENIRLAIAGLKSNKMRALLTMLGIIIGIASVIAIISVGNAMTSSVSSSMAEMGSNNITVSVKQKSTTSSTNNKTKDGRQGNASGMPGGGGMPAGGGAMPGGGGMPGGSGAPGGGPGGGGNRSGGSKNSTSTAKDSDLLSMDQINTIEDTFKDSIDSISISENGSSGKAKDGDLYANVSIIGTNTGYQDVKNIKLTDGRYISDKDMDGAKKVAVVSDKLVEKMFGTNSDPIGQQVKIYTSNKILTYTVIGVYKYETSGETSTESEENLSTNLYVPVTTVKTSSTNKNYQSFTIKTAENVDIQSFTDELSQYLSTLYQKNTKWQASASNMQSMLESMTSMMSSIALAISVIAGISLIVGGIGVMNIMLVSVTERTREIGTRKALGAKSSHIKMQFIIESVIICSIGGLIGIILGVILGAVGAKVMGRTPVISIPIILISFTFSMAIGVFFGYYPAKKASKLDPIEALRYE